MLGYTDVPGFWSVKGFKVTVLTLMMFKCMYYEVSRYFKPYGVQLNYVSFMMQSAED
jgi:hypothetical protein